MECFIVCSWERVNNNKPAHLKFSRKEPASVDRTSTANNQHTFSFEMFHRNTNKENGNEPEKKNGRKTHKWTQCCVRSLIPVDIAEWIIGKAVQRTAYTRTTTFSNLPIVHTMHSYGYYWHKRERNIFIVVQKLWCFRAHVQLNTTIKRDWNYHSCYNVYVVATLLMFNWYAEHRAYAVEES